jgi:hypothetical protein
MKSRVLKMTGVLGCFFALFLMLGGHWVLLQSIAWTRMLVDYSHDGSLAEAIGKTFDGRHPCKMCLKIRKAWPEEQRRVPMTILQQQPELWLDTGSTTVSLPPVGPRRETSFVPQFHSNFKPSPPKPPPRAV